jgi:hypothetical protein
MFKPVNFLILSLAYAVAGCGGSAPKELPVAKSAHGGTMVPLPNGQGFAEILVDSTQVGVSGGKAQFKPKIIAYFFESDGTSAMKSGATDVKIKIGTGENGRVVDLAAEPREAGKFASMAGEYPEGFAGQLAANLNGEAVEVAVRVR